MPLRRGMLIAANPHLNPKKISHLIDGEVNAFCWCGMKLLPTASTLILYYF